MASTSPNRIWRDQRMASLLRQELEGKGQLDSLQEDVEDRVQEEARFGSDSTDPNSCNDPRQMPQWCRRG